jgi:hypothetical protein
MKNLYFILSFSLGSNAQVNGSLVIDWKDSMSYALMLNTILPF